MRPRRLRLETLEGRDLCAAFLPPANFQPQPGGLGSAVTITYSINNLDDGGLGGTLTPAQVRAAVAYAFQQWANVAPLHFVEVPDVGPPVPELNNYGDYYDEGAATIRLNHARIIFPAGVAAEEFGASPFIGKLTDDIFVNRPFAWTEFSGLDLVKVLTHEIGHAVGLDHSPGSVMATSLNGSPPWLGRLFADDVIAVRSIYGAGVGSVTPLPRPDDAPIPAGFEYLPQGDGSVLVTKGGFSTGTTLAPFEGYRGQFRVASGDVNGDGVPDALFSALGHVRAYDGVTGLLLLSLRPYENYYGDVYVDASEGYLVTAAETTAGGAPVLHRKLFGPDGSEAASYYVPPGG